MLKIAIVGAGWAGSRQAEAIHELNRKVQIACLVDSDSGHLRRRAGELGVVDTYLDYAKALSDPNVDAVSLCTPHALHAPQAVAAAEAGKHVLVEKPMALSVEDATRMLNAASDNDVALYVAENRPYEPDSRFLHEVVRSGDPIGELTSASVTAGFHAPEYDYPGRRAWLSSPEAGGTWMLHGIHTVAGLRHILCSRYGEVTTVYLREHSASSFQRDDLEGTMAGLLTFASGLNVHITQTAETALPGTLDGYVLHGDRASMRAGKNGYQIYDSSTGRDTEPPVQPYPEQALSSYALELEAFADFITGHAHGPTDGISERRTLAVVQAGYESVIRGEPVDLRERFDEI